MKIEDFSFRGFTVKEHIKFFEDFTVGVNKFSATQLLIDNEFSIFMAEFAEERKAYKKAIKSIMTPELVALDHNRDLTYRGLHTATKASENHFEPVKQAASKKILVYFDTYKNVVPMAMNVETVAISNLIEDLRAKCATEINLLGLNDRLDQLELENNVFNAKYAERIEETIENAAPSFVNVKVKVEESYKKIVERINAQLVLYPTPVLIEFATLINAIADKALLLIAQRKGKKGKK